MSNIKKFRIKSFKDNRAILKLDKISLKYGRKTILDNLNLQLNNGQILGLLGPNGVGKSTIFNLITGLISPDFGSISINSEIINKYPIFERTLKYKIGFVPQNGGFFMSVEERVQKIVCEQLGVSPEEVKLAASFIDDLGADSLDTVELVMAFEEEFEIEIPDEEAEEISTVQNAVDYINNNS